MNSKQIQAISVTDMSERAWLKEIALQLAILNEPKRAGRPPKEKDGIRS